MILASPSRSLAAAVVTLVLVVLGVPARADAPGTQPFASAHRSISTSVPEAQAAFDLGLTMLYAFDIGLARDEFARAVRLDPDCAMAYWGEAESEVTDINDRPNGDAIARGAAAIAKARAAAEATPAERGLVAAAAPRFAPHRSESARQTDYAKAMRAYVRTDPRDVTALVATAFAIWMLPGDVSDRAEADLGTDLDAALALDPSNLGALHLRIHYEESIDTPERARSDADTLAAMTFAPGASHLDHMPGHIYDRVGDYPRMIDANERALANDLAFFADAATLYPGASDAGVAYMRTYHAHDLAFVLYGDTTIGRDEAATALAAREGPDAVAHVALRLHRWQAALDSGTTDSQALALADARLGRPTEAEGRLGKAPDRTTRDLVDAAEAIARGDESAALARYAAAYGRTASLTLGDPKDRWFAPIGESYGAALIRVKRYANAETVFAAELKRYPHDPRLLFGLAAARAKNAMPAEMEGAASMSGWQGRAALSFADLG